MEGLIVGNVPKLRRVVVVLLKCPVRRRRYDKMDGSIGDPAQVTGISFYEEMTGCRERFINRRLLNHRPFATRRHRCTTLSAPVGQLILMYAFSYQSYLQGLASIRQRARMRRPSRSEVRRRAANSCSCRAPIQPQKCNRALPLALLGQLPSTSGPRSACVRQAAIAWAT